MEVLSHPFPHVVIDNAFNPALVCRAAAEFPGPDPGLWPVNYSSLLEKKRTANDWSKMPASIVLLLNQMLAYPVHTLNLISASEPLIPDASLWGGGLHAMGRGDHLDLHEDSDHHAKLGLHRRLNAILFLNPTWNAAWNGCLEFWDREVTTCRVAIKPKANRLVFFVVDDGNIHGLPEPLQCPVHLQRMSLATFWFSPAPERKLKRPRAKFVARPYDLPDPAKDRLRAERAKF